MSQIDVTIMGQAYKLACKEGEEAALMEAAAYLDEKMLRFRDTSKIKGTDKIAVMAALAISTELFAAKAADGPLSGLSMVEINNQIHSMHKVMDGVLETQENLF